MYLTKGQLLFYFQSFSWVCCFSKISSKESLYQKGIFWDSIFYYPSYTTKNKIISPINALLLILLRKRVKLRILLIIQYWIFSWVLSLSLTMLIIDKGKDLASQNFSSPFSYYSFLLFVQKLFFHHVFFIHGNCKTCIVAQMQIGKKKKKVLLILKLDIY